MSLGLSPLCHSLFWLTIKVLVLCTGWSSSCSVSGLSMVSEQLYLSALVPGSERTVGFSQHLSSLDRRKLERLLGRLESKDYQTPNFDVVLDSRCGLVASTGQLVANEVSHLCADLPAARHFFFCSQNTMQSGSLPSTYSQSIRETRPLVTAAKICFFSLPPLYAPLKMTREWDKRRKDRWW